MLRLKGSVAGLAFPRANRSAKQASDGPAADLRFEDHIASDAIRRFTAALFTAVLLVVASMRALFSELQLCLPQLTPEIVLCCWNCNS
jgi:hypothetical protein